MRISDWSSDVCSSDLSIAAAAFANSGQICVARTRLLVERGIASKLTRTFTDRHGLKDLCRDLLAVELSKQQQSSDWGADELTEAQLRYAANDEDGRTSGRERGGQYV